jgi:hypothetical protein
MKNLAVIGVGLAWLVAGGGCQCCHVFEPYADVIDHVSDHEHSLECLYHPAFDLNRIGKPDWCTCPLNRLLCHRACKRLWVDPRRYLPAVGQGHWYGRGGPLLSPRTQGFIVEERFLDRSAAQPASRESAMAGAAGSLVSCEL